MKSAKLSIFLLEPPLHGCIAVRGGDGGHLGHMELGRAIGEESLLTRQPSPVTVEAVSEVLVLRMPAATFGRLLMTRPDVVQHIQILKRRESVTGQLRAR